MQDRSGIPFEAADRIVGIIFAGGVPRWVEIFLIPVGIMVSALIFQSGFLGYSK